MELDLDAPGLIGRGAVWAELVALLDEDRRPGALLLTGPAGIGKTSLVERFATRAAELGHPVARAAGEGGEPYTALRELLARADLRELPDGQRRALRAALDDSGEPIDLLALRLAVCSAFSRLASDRPLVVVVDDVDRIDAASFDLLLTLASVISWGQLPAVGLFASRTERVPVELAELLPQVAVPPLTEREADRLLDDLPEAPAGSARLDVLRRAAGNPLALREYAELAEQPSDSVAGVFARRVRELPEASLRALTLAAAGERNFAVILRADPAATLSAWQPAEDAGLITITDAAVRFRHPLVEYAVLEAAGPDAERDAHLRLAEVTADPLRALWHRAGAAENLDTELGEALVEASRRLDGAGAVTAVTLLEHAHDLFPAERRTRVLIEAAERAAAVGRIRWAGDLLDRAAAAHDPETAPELDRFLAALSSWTLTMRGWLAEASVLLTSKTNHAWQFAQVTGTASLPVFLLGRGPLYDAVREHADETPTVPMDWFPLAATRADERVREAVLAQPEAVPGSAQELIRAGAVGAAALLLDEPEHALTLLTPVVRAVVEGTAAGVFLTAPGAAGWALIDIGRWVEAERWMVPLLSSPVGAEATLVRFGTDAQLAIVAYGRGRESAAEELLARTGQWSRVPLFVLRVEWAAGVAAAARGEHEEAYHRLVTALAVQHDARILALPDLVAAALATGRTDEAAAAVAEVRDWYGDRWLSERRRLRLAAAEALLTGDPEPVAAVVDAPQSRRWPFERAVLAVELADRLRRAQQARPARYALLDALETFERVGAQAWVSRVKGELRIEAPVADPFAALSPQQEQIARLAAEGLSNREIGERLFLSPRTIGSHLYRMFPQLGVANRTELSDLVAGLDRKDADAVE